MYDVIGILRKSYDTPYNNSAISIRQRDKSIIVSPRYPNNQLF